jgi:septal ring factor EnvC (AmiA/AmiB activator)
MDDLMNDLADDYAHSAAEQRAKALSRQVERLEDTVDDLDSQLSATRGDLRRLEGRLTRLEAPAQPAQSKRPVPPPPSSSSAPPRRLSKAAAVRRVRHDLATNPPSERYLRNLAQLTIGNPTLMGVFEQHINAGRLEEAEAVLKRFAPTT